jgi:hypothetical protein
LGVVDVQISRILPEKRKAVFADALENAGPPDGSVLLQVNSCKSFNDCFFSPKKFIFLLIDEV